MELNDNNVVEVLSELLPYIEADGGWLEYVETDYMAEGAFVKVRLGGACSTCAMSAMTLKQGIEKKLRKLSERPWMNGLLIVSTLRKIGVKELIIVLNQIVKV